MNTPFNRQNLAGFIKEGSDAHFKNIIFRDGSKLTPVKLQQIANNLAAINSNDTDINSIATTLTHKASLSTNTFTGVQTLPGIQGYPYKDLSIVAADDLNLHTNNGAVYIRGESAYNAFQFEVSRHDNTNTGVRIGVDPNWEGGRVMFKSSGDDYKDCFIGKDRENLYIVNGNDKADNIYLSQNPRDSFLGLVQGGHHLDSYYSDITRGRDLYLNYYANANVRLRGAAVVDSDDRLKQEEQFITNATETLLKLRPQTYLKYPSIHDISTVKPNLDVSGKFESGLIAQEIYYDAPELRHLVSITDISGDVIIPSSDDPQNDPDYGDWGDMPSGVQYEGLIPYLIKSNQELAGRLDALEKKNNNI